MSVDLVDALNVAGDLLGIVAIGIFLFAAYRAFAIGRLLVSGAYRNRAFWTGGTLIALILLTIASSLPASNPLGSAAFVLIFVVLLAFVDSSIKVTQDTDFFHRSPLGWQRLRKPLYIIIIPLLVVGALTIGLAPPNSNLTFVGVVLWFGAGGAALSLSAAAMVVGAKRTSDRSMRRFVRMLGLAIICMVLFFTVWIPFSPFSATVQDLGSLFSEFFIPLAAYFLYLAVMSLSPVGRIEKEVSANSIPHETGVTQPARFSSCMPSPGRRSSAWSAVPASPQPGASGPTPLPPGLPPG
jgi:hypothetical protein